MKRIAPVVQYVSLKNAFEDKKTLSITRQALYLINLLVVAKLILILHLLFKILVIYSHAKIVFIPKNRSINSCNSFSFQLTSGKIITWDFTK